MRSFRHSSPHICQLISFQVHSFFLSGKNTSAVTLTSDGFVTVTQFSDAGNIDDDAVSLGDDNSLMVPPVSHWSSTFLLNAPALDVQGKTDHMVMTLMTTSWDSECLHSDSEDVEHALQEGSISSESVGVRSRRYLIVFCVCVCSSVTHTGERERQKARERQRETETDRDRQPDRDRERQRNTERDREVILPHACVRVETRFY